MTNIGIPSLSLDPEMTWCKMRALRVCRVTAWRSVNGFGGGKSKMADHTFIDDMLTAHNKYREEHQVAPLKHNKDLSAHAQKWANHLAAIDAFDHSDCNYKGERVGENIAMKWSSQPAAYTGQDATDQWYSEIAMHTTFGSSTSNSETGHFTQVVWKGSKELGVGRAVTKDNKVIVVANYRPAGNMMGDYAANVLAPKFGKIKLPPKSENKPMKMAFNRRDDDGAGESRSTVTRRVTEGSGANKVIKEITEETIVKANGEKIVNRSEQIIQG